MSPNFKIGIMKNKSLLLALVAMGLLLCFSSCKKDKVVDGLIEGAVTDIDGNTYNAVQLGDQVWMASNLRCTKYADGTGLTYGLTVTSDAPCYYPPNDNIDIVDTCGYLYNWKAVMRGSSTSYLKPSGVQGICPDGWHVPSVEEWRTLLDYLGTNANYITGENSRNVAKSLAANELWTVDSINAYTVGNDLSANNATLFTAYPAGSYNGNYVRYGTRADFWTCSEHSATAADIASLSHNSPIVSINNGEKTYGRSVRCVKD